MIRVSIREINDISLPCTHYVVETNKVIFDYKNYTISFLATDGNRYLVDLKDERNTIIKLLPNEITDDEKTNETKLLNNIYKFMNHKESELMNSGMLNLNMGCGVTIIN